MLLLFSPANWT